MVGAGKRKIDMQDMVASIFILFVLALYAGISLVFIIAGIRKWIWRPIATKISPSHSESDYRRVKSTRQEESPS